MTSKGSTSGRRVLRSVPDRTVEHCRAAHDVRHQSAIPHLTGAANPYGQLDQLDQERQRLEKRLSIWLAQKERTEAQIADVERARDHLLATLEPVIRSEVEEAERAATEAQIADVERARDQLLATLEPVLHSGAKKAERATGIRHRGAAEAKRSASSLSVDGNRRRAL